MANLKKLRELYDKAKAAKVGETVICPSCGSSFKKLSYQQAFCKSKPGTQCKDYYWNNVTPSKRNNTTRISPASAAYMAKMARYREEREYREDFDDDPSWDAHKSY